MKDNLEYKILKFLSENNDEESVDVSNLETDKRLLKRKLLKLKKEKLIKYGSGINLSFSNGTNLKTDFIRARIEFKGNEYLKDIESKNKNITNNFNNSTIGQINQDTDFFESPNYIKTKAVPSNSPVIKSRLNTILSNPWFIGISLALMAAIFNGRRFMSFINNILDKF